MYKIKKTFGEDVKRDIKLFCKIMQDEHGVTIAPHLYETCSCCELFSPEEELADGDVNLNIPKNWASRHIKVRYNADDNIRKALNKTAKRVFSNKEMYPKLTLAKDVTYAILIDVADHA